MAGTKPGSTSSDILSTEAFMDQERKRVAAFNAKKDRRKRDRLMARLAGGRRGGGGSAGASTPSLGSQLLNQYAAKSGDNRAMGLVPFLTPGFWGSSDSRAANSLAQGHVMGILSGMAGAQGGSGGGPFGLENGTVTYSTGGGGGNSPIRKVIRTRGGGGRGGGRTFSGVSVGGPTGDPSLRLLDIQDRKNKSEMYRLILDQLRSLSDPQEYTKKEDSEQWVNNAGGWEKKPLRRTTRETERPSDTMRAIAPLLNFLGRIGGE